MFHQVFYAGDQGEGTVLIKSKNDGKYNLKLGTETHEKPLIDYKMNKKVKRGTRAPVSDLLRRQTALTCSDGSNRQQPYEAVS